MSRRGVAPAGLHVGTSGWAYDDWVGPFYPAEVPPRRWLECYQRTFGTVELNVTFYRLPRDVVFRGWAERAAPGFRFAVKGPRLVTHYRRLRDVDAILQSFLARVRLLGPHLGPILWQLPPALGRDDARLEGFLGRLPHDLVHAFEFRHPSWFDEGVFALLRSHGAACVTWHMPERASPVTVTGPHAYLRFHGTGTLYDGRYPARDLQRWAALARRWLDEGREVWAYFNNDIGAHAPEDARRLIEQVSAVTRSPRARRRHGMAGRTGAARRTRPEAPPVAGPRHSR